MYTFLVVLHVIISLALIFIILIQVSRGATGSSFLGGSSDSLLMGPAGDVFLKKTVMVLGILFVITSISISVSVKQRGVKFPAAAPAGAPSPQEGAAR